MGKRIKLKPKLVSYCPLFSGHVECKLNPIRCLMGKNFYIRFTLIATYCIFFSAWKRQQKQLLKDEVKWTSYVAQVWKNGESGWRLRKYFETVFFLMRLGEINCMRFDYECMRFDYEGRWSHQLSVHRYTVWSVTIVKFRVKSKVCGLSKAHQIIFEINFSIPTINWIKNVFIFTRRCLKRVDDVSDKTFEDKNIESFKITESSELLDGLKKKSINSSTFTANFSQKVEIKSKWSHLQFSSSLLPCSAHRMSKLKQSTSAATISWSLVLTPVK